MIKLFDFLCSNCGEEFEDWIERDETMATCPNCGTMAAKTISVPRIGAFSAMSKEFQTAHLKERSAKHSAKEFKRNEDEHRFRLKGGKVKKPKKAV